MTLNSLADALRDATGYPWEQLTRDLNRARLYLGAPQPQGDGVMGASYSLLVTSAQMRDFRVLVRPLNAPPEPLGRAVHVARSMTWDELLDFVGQLVEELGGVSDEYPQRGANW